MVVSGTVEPDCVCEPCDGDRGGGGALKFGETGGEQGAGTQEKGNGKFSVGNEISKAAESRRNSEKIDHIT